MEVYGLSRDVVENLRIELESTLSELLRFKPVQVTKQQVAPTSTQYSRRETQDSYRATMPATRTAPQCYSEDEGLCCFTVIVSLPRVSICTRSADRQAGCRSRGHRGILPLCALMDAVSRNICRAVGCYFDLANSVSPHVLPQLCAVVGAPFHRSVSPCISTISRLFIPFIPLTRTRTVVNAVL